MRSSSTGRVARGHQRLTQCLREELMGATPLGFGSPTSFPTPSLIPGLSPYGGVSANPFSQLQSQSPMQVPGVVAPYASHALLQTQQALQAAVQQLQQLLQIEYLQQ